jgi:ABC-2 type transport system permease protein
MNVYLRELKAHRKALFFWSIGMVFLVASGIAKFAAYQTSGQSIASIVDQFPKTVQIIFGTNGFNLTKVSGYYGVLFLYIALMATAHAALLGSEMISKEERDRTSEFLFVRPIKRSRVITAKLFAGLTNLVILNVVTLLSSLYFINYFTKGRQDITHYILLMSAALFIMQMIFFSIGTAVAGAVKKPKASGSIATSILVATLLLMFLINLNGRIDALKYLTPFKYYDASAILASNMLDRVYIVISAGIIAAAIYATYYLYTRRDLNV